MFILRFWVYSVKSQGFGDPLRQRLEGFPVVCQNHSSISIQLHCTIVLLLFLWKNAILQQVIGESVGDGGCEDLVCSKQVSDRSLVLWLRRILDF